MALSLLKILHSRLHQLVSYTETQRFLRRPIVTKLTLRAGFRRDYGAVTGGFATLPINLPGTRYRKALQARDRIIAFLRKSMPAYVRTHTWIGVSYLAFNVHVPALHDVRVRRALSMAIDRDFITKKLLRGGQQPAYTSEAFTHAMPRGTYGNGPLDWTTDFSTYERCITRGVLGSQLNVIYGNGSVALSKMDAHG